MSMSVNDNYMSGKLVKLENYVARISAFAAFKAIAMPKIKYDYIKVD